MNFKKIIAWAFYDWASSAYPILITTFVFATYFTTKVAPNPIIGTYEWGSATALAGIIIAIASPLFGAIADLGGRHKRWLFTFTWLCILFTALLWFVFPNPHSVPVALVLLVLSTIFLEIAIVFYNSFLPHIVPENYIGRLSGWSWGFGYLGGIVVLSIALFVFLKNDYGWFNERTAEQVRICAPFVALWLAIFSLPIFIFVPDTKATGLKASKAITKGLNDLLKTLKELPQNKNLSLYLLAHLIYVDGLNTLFAFGGIYAAGTFGLSLNEVVLLGIAMNISAGIGSIAFAWVDDAIGSKRTILISLVCLIGFEVPILFVHTHAFFWALALALAIFVGPVQAASRSLMARITPKDKSTEMFGLYAFSGRITAFLGPWLIGIVTYYSHSQRVGMSTILAFFIVGGILMSFVKEPKFRLANIDNLH